MNSRFSRLALLACGLLAVPLLVPSPALAQTAQANNSQDKPFLHALFSDNAVLQRDRAVPVWGWTAPGQTVTVNLDGKNTTAKADASGQWMARIGPYSAGGPHTLKVAGATPAENITRNNILFGDVWLCSGQSNMEMGIGNVNNADQEIAAANYPNIRLFTLPRIPSDTPLTNVNSQWLICNPTNIKQGNWNGFSAVGYFFGRKLNQELGIPIGLISSSWGGTIAEAWVSESSLGTLTDFQAPIAAAHADVAQRSVPFPTRMETWVKANDPGYDTNWTTSTNDTQWKTISLPGSWEGSGITELTDFDGVTLFRREVIVPDAWAGHDLTLSLGAIDDIDETYWNGKVVGSTNGWMAPRSYTIPGAQVKAGRNLIAIRVTDTGGNGGLSGPADALKLSLNAANSLPLGGAWKYHISIPAAKLSTMPKPSDSGEPNRVDVLYNGMIAPLQPYGIRGAIWYQGESNAGRAEQYNRLLPVLINDWRKQFNTQLPFYIVQLSGFMAPDDAPKNDDWPRLRAAQQHTADTVANSGIAITTDIGDEKDIHPKDKQNVGLRLALSALAQTYGKKVEYLGPVFKSATPQGERLALNFSHTEGGLSIKGDANRIFAVAGADRNWFWATPQIDGNRVILTSPVVPKPLYARYAWSNLPRATLYNGAALPAAPFQTLP